jgi:hypothetical protein
MTRTISWRRHRVRIRYIVHYNTTQTSNLKKLNCGRRNVTSKFLIFQQFIYKLSFCFLTTAAGFPCSPVIGFKLGFLSVVVVVVVLSALSLEDVAVDVVEMLEVTLGLGNSTVGRGFGTVDFILAGLERGTSVATREAETTGGFLVATFVVTGPFNLETRVLGIALSST